MTDAWDGRPQNPERDGWHWVQWVSGDDHISHFEVMFWSADTGWYSVKARPQPVPVMLAGWRYLGPALLPAQVAAAVADALRQARADGIREAAGMVRKLNQEHTKTVVAGLETTMVRNRTADEIAAAIEAAAARFPDDDAAAAIHARGPSSALADALRQAEARGMREAAARLKRFADRTPWPPIEQAYKQAILAILAAADAKEKPDAE